MATAIPMAEDKDTLARGHSGEPSLKALQPIQMKAENLISKLDSSLSFYQ